MNINTKILQYDKTIAVFYPCTKKEYESGSLFTSLDLLVSTSPSINFSFDLFLFFDVNFDIDNSAFDKYIDCNFFNKLTIKFLNLSDVDNMYMQPWKGNPSVVVDLPEHGLSSGPNNSFYQSLYHLIGLNDGYENFLLLETDIQILKDNWYDVLKDYCKKNTFLIAGSKYKGIQKWHRILDYKDHLNGIALYKNCSDLLYLLKESESYLIHKISNDAPFMNFDIAIDEWRRTPSGKSFFEKSQPLLDVEFITNASDPEDELVSRQKILNFYPETIFLHHKTSKHNFSFTSLGAEKFETSKSQNLELGLKYFASSDFKIKIPLFFHIPKNAGTFCEALTTVFLRKFNRDYFLSQSKEIRIKNKGSELFNVYIIDDEIVTNNRNFKHIESITYAVELSDLDKDFFRDLPVFSITVNSLGFRNFHWLFDFFNYDDFAFVPYCILRDPLERSVSMYEYNNSSISSHDLNHGLIAYDSYLEYIDSIRFEDAWLLRNLLNVPDSIEIDDEIYNSFTKLFNLFKVFSLKDSNLNQSIASFYDNIYNLDVNSIPKDWYNITTPARNENQSKKFTINDLSDEVKQSFYSRSKYDYRIYNDYTK